MSSDGLRDGLKDADQRPLLILSLEGLATAAIGCYGSSWNQTPAIDRIAASGCVWDRWISTVDDPIDSVCDVLQKADQWIEPWRKRGSVNLITDVAAVAGAADEFDMVTSIRSFSSADASSDDRMPADEIDDTCMGSIFAEAMQQDAQTDGQWSLMWLHSDVLTKCWDAPRHLFPIDEVELCQEPEEFADLSEPVKDIGDWDTLPPIMPGCGVPQIDLSSDGIHHPDVVTTWMRTYGCQIRLLDVLIEVLLQSLIHDDPQVMLMGTSGFSLGQNGWIGHRSGPLRSQDCRLPMLISDAGPIRLPAITPATDFASILSDLGTGCTGWSGPKQWIIDDARSVRTRSDRAANARTTSRWFFVKDLDQSEHLYLKPDDAEDFNDIARLMPEVVAELIDDDCS